MSRITFYLVRHGESEGNREGLFRGRHDFPLTPLGIKQAESVKRALNDINFDLIVSSPLKRAYDTARIIANGRPVRVMEEFNNINLSIWEGKKKDYIKTTYPEEWDIWLTQPEELRIEGAETIDDVQKRAVFGIQALIDEYKDGGIICIVSHRAVLKPLLAGVLNIQKPYFWRLHFDTASYSILEYEKKRGFTLMKLNITHHLPSFEVERI